MKLLITTALLLNTILVQAQMLLKGAIKNLDPEEMIVVNVPQDNWYHTRFSDTINIINGKFETTIAITRPQVFFLDIGSTRLLLYAEPGKSLGLRWDDQAKETSLVFTGSLQRENRFRNASGLCYNSLFPQRWNDTLTAPDSIVTCLQQNQRWWQQQLDKIQSVVSPAFYRFTKAELQYAVTGTILHLLYNNKIVAVGYKGPYELDSWRPVIRNAYSNIPLSNDEAVDSYLYLNSLTYYPKCLEWTMTMEEYTALMEKIFEEPFEEIKKHVRSKGKNYLEYRIYQYVLKGKALERFIASFICKGIFEGELTYLFEAYQDYLQRFPGGRSRQMIDSIMQPYLLTRKLPVPEDIHFVADDLAFTSLESIKAAYPGKVLYIDLWGTWCGPCRDQFAYTYALKKRYTGKEVVFIYVAYEYNTDPRENWVSTVKFYKLPGIHILAGKDLMDNFRKLYGQDGRLVFPSFILVDRQGKTVTLNAGYPSSGEALYKQIDAVLD